MDEITATATEGTRTMMRLQYLTANAAWVFTFGDAPITMGLARMFHDTREDAVRAANDCGLVVTRSGEVLTPESAEWAAEVNRSV